jgi:hypothetical protein
LKVTLQNRGGTTLQWNSSPFSLFRTSLASEDRTIKSGRGDDWLEIDPHRFNHIILCQLKPGESFVWEHELVVTGPLQMSTVIVTVVAQFQIVGVEMPVEFPCATLKLPVPAVK